MEFRQFLHLVEIAGHLDQIGKVDHHHRRYLDLENSVDLVMSHFGQVPDFHLRNHHFVKADLDRVGPSLI